MESERNIEELIEELRALRLRETAVIAEIEGAIEARTRRTTGTISNDNNIGATPQLEAVVNGIRRGDRVRITNKVRKPATAAPTWTEQKEREATVTRVTPQQIHIVTDNGTRTWRGPNNLRRQG